MRESPAASQKATPHTDSSARANCAPTHRVVPRSEALEARTAMLAKEKECSRLRDQMSAEQRALPWVRIEKEYTFDGPSGKVTLAQLFNGRSQLFLKHFMLGPGQKNNCVGCAFEVDHLEGLLVHLENHDLTYAAVARAPIEEIEAYRKNMGWKFPWVSSYRSDFNYDFNVSFAPEQLALVNASYNFGQRNPGMEDLSGDSVFFKAAAGYLIPPSAAAVNNFSARTAISMSRRKAATKTARITRSPIGCAPKICTAKAVQSKATEGFTPRDAVVRLTSKRLRGRLSLKKIRMKALPQRATLECCAPTASAASSRRE